MLAKIEAADVKLAFEYEPSVHCALGTFESVGEVCENGTALSDSDTRWNRIGINLDIAHWAFIGGHKAKDVPELVCKRIFHAHISSLGTGHLADGPLEDEEIFSLHTKEEYLEWLLLLERVSKSGNFSGFVSLELECSKSKTMVLSSLHKLEQWLKK